MTRIPCPPPAPVRYFLVAGPYSGTTLTRVLEAEDARLWHGLDRISRESPSFFAVLTEVVRGGMHFLDDRMIAWGLQTGLLTENPDDSQGQPRFLLHEVARHFVLGHCTA